MIFFTWNLNIKPKALLLVIEHLKNSNESFVAAFQETPVHNSSNFINSGFQILAEEKGLTIIGSGDIRLKPKSKPVIITNESIPLASNRVIGLEAITPIGNVFVFNVHFANRRTLPQGEYRAITMKAITDDMKKIWKGKPTVIMGDFNANPYHSEIASPANLGAWRNASELQFHSKGKSEQAPRLYNPMWQWLIERNDHPHGTHRYYDGVYSEVEWHCYDQILISLDLINNAGKPDILLKLNKKPLVHDGKPNSIRPYLYRMSQYSDHLPVQLKISNP